MLNNIQFNDAADAEYCEKLANHFAAMGISEAKAQTAIASLVEQDAVPDFIPSTPSLSGFFASLNTKPQAQPSFQGDLAYSA